MNDNDIIKALECMASVNENGLCYAEQENIKRMKEGKPYIVCSNIKDEKFECCPHYQEPFDTCMDDGSHQKALQSALDIITRQKAEIEELRDKVSKNPKTIPRLLREVKVDAIKGFVERLKKEKYYSGNRMGYGTWVVEVERIDNLVKEMVGERE